jgi:hypothetical protein
MPGASAFSLVDGGPLCALMRRVGWTHPDGRIDHLKAGIVLVAVAWLPIVVAMVAVRLSAPHSFVIDWSVHSRLLIAIPLLLRAEVSLHMRTRLVADQLVSDRWTAGRTEQYDRAVAAAVRHRDAALPEVVMFAMAVVASEIVVWNLGGMPFGARRVTLAHHLLAARWWYALVALPMFQFLVYRSLWRWGIWVQMLWRLSRLGFRPVATHPDLAGGLEFLSWPSVGFAYVVAALSSVQAGVWADQVLHAGVKVTDLKAQAGVFAVAGVILALGPLLMFAGQLWNSQILGRYQYGGLATDYTRQFQARWFERSDRDDVLGTADIQSLADLANGYGVVSKMRIVPFGPRAIIAVAAAAVIPMVPVALLGIPLPELLGKLGGAFLGKPG